MKTSIVTVCCNRLEYTISHVNSIHDKIGTEDYEHIVVNQGSNDGTKEWLDSISQLDWFRKVRPIHLEENKGMWFGLRHGVENSSCDNLILSDNDIVVETCGFEQKMQAALVSPYSIVQATSREAIYRTPSRVGTQEISYPTGLFMLNKANFRPHFKIPDDYQHTDLRSICIREVIVTHQDGWGPDTNSTISKLKYPPEIVYGNLTGDCPMGRIPFRPEGKESSFYQKIRQQKWF